MEEEKMIKVKKIHIETKGKGYTTKAEISNKDYDKVAYMILYEIMNMDLEKGNTITIEMEI